MESLTDLYRRRDRYLTVRAKALHRAEDAPEGDIRKVEAYADVVDYNARLAVVEGEIALAWEEVSVD